MSDAPIDLMAANAPYADAFSEGHLEAPPARKLAVLTCMDARVEPLAALGLQLGDAHVIRNAGGRASDDAVRSLVVSSRLLGVRQVAVIHHTRCGNAGTADELAAKLRDAGVEDLPAELHPNTPSALADDVARLRDEQGMAEGTVVEGFTYDVESGRLIPLDG